MTVTLGAITFNDGVRLLGVGNEPRIAMSVRQTLGGRVVAQNIPLSSGRQLVLEAYRSGGGIRGYFTGAQFLAAAALRDAGTAVALVHHLGTFSVIVTAVDMEPINGVADPDSSSLYLGTITMSEV